jgi:hypothetical protein
VFGLLTIWFLTLTIPIVTKSVLLEFETFTNTIEENDNRIFSENNFPNFALVWLPAVLCHGESALPHGVPPLDEMAGDWLPMIDVANPPDVNNFHDMLLVSRDLTSFFCYPEDWLWEGGEGVWHAGYPRVTLTIAGKEYPATECRWYPHRALRRNTNCAGFAVQTDTRMINEQRAVLVRVQIANPATTKTNIELTLLVSGILQADGISLLNTSQRPGFVTVICSATKPGAVTNDNGIVHWRWNVSLPAGGRKEVEFVAGDGHAAEVPKVQAEVKRWSANFSK